MHDLALYRKYRPASFKEVLGQDHITKVLESSVETNKVSHAYLFVGSRGTGKTSVARIFANEIGVSVNDLYEIDAASNRGIEDIRALRDGARVLPFDSKYKVYIIDEAHMLTAEAFNAFLKTLEEPPGHIVFILATTELAKIPETIFSRCQHFSFTKLPFTQVLGRLQSLSRQEGVAVEADVLEEVARKSGGALRDAESLLGQILSLGKKEISQTDASLFLPKVGFEKVFARRREG